MADVEEREIKHDEDEQRVDTHDDANDDEVHPPSCLAHRIAPGTFVRLPY